MTNGGLLQEGNAALAMNLAGDRQRVIWYAPQQVEGEIRLQGIELTDLIPDAVTWIVLQLCLVVLLLALWQGRRVGPLVAEDLPVVVRASETVEGRGRLYRSRRARDRAAEALRTATLQRLLPRLGLAANAPACRGGRRRRQRVRGRPEHRCITCCSARRRPPTPTWSHLAHALDDIERQVTQS